MKRVIGFIKFFSGFLAFIILMLIVFFGYRDIPLNQLKNKYANQASLFLPLGNMDIHYRDEGNPKDSIPLVLIHGTGSSLHTFDVWTEELKSNYRVIRMDLPGYGLTGPFDHRDYSIDSYVDFLDSFLENLNVNKCIVAGNSLGGEIAWNYTLKNSKQIEKLILINSSGYPSNSDSTPLAFKLAKFPILKHILVFITPRFIAESSVKNVYANQEKVTTSLVDRYFELTLRSGNRQAFVDRFDAAKDSTRYRRIQNISTKTLVLWGAEDKLIPINNALRFNEDLTNDSLVILKNVSHVPMEEMPHKSLQVLLSFL